GGDVSVLLVGTGLRGTRAAVAHAPRYDARDPHLRCHHVPPLRTQQRLPEDDLDDPRLHRRGLGRPGPRASPRAGAAPPRPPARPAPPPPPRVPVRPPPPPRRSRSSACASRSPASASCRGGARSRPP